MCSALGSVSAFAGGPPVVDPSRLPANVSPAPPDKTEQKTACWETVRTGSDSSAGKRDLDVSSAWAFGKGAGQTVAVIDTGVARHPRLPGLVGAGDYVSTTDGTDDCDAHGTIVAGIIAAGPAEGDGFSGVAPQARIVSIRQSSSHWQVAGRSKQQQPEDVADGYGNTSTMAAAIRRAADLGATVINISEVACSTSAMNDASLGAAVQYAALQRNVVVVAAAGNNDRCQAGNPGPDPLHPDADPWAKVTTIVSPAWYDDYVLTVGSVNADGAPSEFTVPGPWVDVAAPGEQIVSLDPRSPGLTNAKVDDKGATESFSGTSFAAPFVAGTAALVRARFPQLSAREVIERIEATAHAPAEGWNSRVGFGVVDPYAAVTADVAGAPVSKQPTRAAAIAIPIPAAPPAPDRRGRNTALIGTAVVGVLLVIGMLASFPMRRRVRAQSTGTRRSG
ncbi:type VII secretion-associated serine protease mycosin [Aldersonia sp. NBC_00410]|uniref:type VII secretion-associated serine protease mycosin n=1 Tax=Aldersonia sp. NBC_00410 TaxID=2975954 RepID=UPI00224F113B|nr:type VII secretion-associated serine protease mycosin [Aldersonia sp. NBC_00410]MCX5043935.1 type VII secretion-associated serine protease mycosin [Aldersonia sp. NBC_00410]